MTLSVARHLAKHAAAGPGQGLVRKVDMMPFGAQPLKT